MAGIDTLRMLELRCKGMTYQEIGDLAGLDQSTICRRLERLEAVIGDPEKIATFRERRTDLYAAIQDKLLAEIVKPDKLEKLSGYQAAGMQHYFWEQERIEQGKTGAMVNVLAVLIENGQVSGDNTLRKLGLNQPQTNNPKRSDSAAGDNTYSEAEITTNK